MIKNIDEMPRSDTLEIDLTGPNGNVYVLLGLVERLGKLEGFPKEYRDAIRENMKESDYERALWVFNEVFGDKVTLYR